MKNLLIIAYYFPPSGGPGVQRVLKHVRYLREFGWNPIVLTVSNGQFPARDESLLEQVPTDILVERTHIYEPYDLYRLLTGKAKGSAIDVNVIKKDGAKSSFIDSLAEFIRATFFIPDARIGWKFTAYEAARKLIKEHNIEAIYSSSPPYTCSIIARKMKREFKLPWVAGFRDPWTGFISSPKRWFLPSAIDKAMEHSTFAEADFVECAWEGIIKDALAKYPDLEEKKFIHVPNGFDSNDLPQVEYTKTDKFTITYTGSMYGRRNPAAFFEAIQNLLDTQQIDANKLHLRFIGRFGDEVDAMFQKASFKNSIEIINYVPHHKSIEYLMLSDALLLVVDESKESAEIVPGKVYEYIGCKRPIIAVAPEEGAIADLIKETKSGNVAHQTNVSEIEKIILRNYTNWLNNSGDFNPNTDAIKKYERREAAKTLAELLDMLS